MNTQQKPLSPRACRLATATVGLLAVMSVATPTRAADGRDHGFARGPAPGFSSYAYHGGAWSRPYPGRYIVGPRIGFSVAVLPPFYSTLWFDGIPYYYADDAYYVWRPDRAVYEVVPPPDGASTPTPAPAASENELFIYPKHNQSAEQQGKDRYECHSWAEGQTGFDPTVAGGGVPAGEASAKRNDYMRAMTVCLEARDYGVK